MWNNRWTWANLAWMSVALMLTIAWLATDSRKAGDIEDMSRCDCSRCFDNAEEDKVLPPNVEGYGRSH